MFSSLVSSQKMRRQNIPENFFNSPDVNPLITKGMVIDAGSGGSRLHVYTWQPRIFNTIPPALSFPESNERLTARIAPGIDSFASDPEAVAGHLAPLIDFAKLTLAGNEKDFKYFPIYLMATGGMRELPYKKRELIIRHVRKLLSDKTFCPFYFRTDFARVISGTLIVTAAL